MAVADRAVNVTLNAHANMGSKTKATLRNACSCRTVIQTLIQLLDIPEDLWHLMPINASRSEHGLSCARNDEGNLRAVGKVHTFGWHDVIYITFVAAMVQIREPPFHWR